MAIPQVKVEVGFDLTDSPSAPFFLLDSDVQGRLDNTRFRLGGTLFYDVTDRAINVDIRRGKQPVESTYSAGQCDVQFNNHDRAFDPLYPLSPYAGNIVPRRELKISSNGVEVYRGWIEDWDLDYSKDGDSVATAKAFDALQLLNNRLVNPHTPAEQASGARIEAILSRPEINWPESQREIDDGQIVVAANPIEEAANVLQYLQSIAGSDPGDVYVTRTGNFAFKDRSKAPSSASFVEFSSADVPFDNLNIQYGSEILFNEIVLTRQNGGTVTVTDQASINEYGARALNVTDSQVSDDQQLVDIGVGLVSLYSEPEYRVSSLDVYLHKLPLADQNRMLSLDFGDVCKLVFTPNGIGDPVEKFLEVINIDHRVDVERHTMIVGFSDIRLPALRLDDAVFGRLDNGVLSW